MLLHHKETDKMRGIHDLGIFYQIIYLLNIQAYIYVFSYFRDYHVVLQHLRVEENPILKMPHLEAASILLVGPTLKKFNDRGIL
jgi:hypothetical protein